VEKNRLEKTALAATATVCDITAACAWGHHQPGQLGIRKRSRNTALATMRAAQAYSMQSRGRAGTGQLSLPRSTWGVCARATVTRVWTQQPLCPHLEPCGSLPPSAAGERPAQLRLAGRPAKEARATQQASCRSLFLSAVPSNPYPDPDPDPDPNPYPTQTLTPTLSHTHTRAHTCRAHLGSAGWRTAPAACAPFAPGSAAG